jgi:hypothetical protein
VRTFAIVTTCNRQGYDVYGRKMIGSAQRHLPADVPVYLYAEGFEPDVRFDTLVVRELLLSCPHLVAFKERHKNNPVAHGLVGRSRLRLIVQWHKPRAKIRRVNWGFGYRWDAVRFSHKVFAICHAAEHCRADALFWMDADIHLFADVSSEFLSAAIPEDCLVSCLLRPEFSECSFMGFNLKNPTSRAFLNALKSFYLTDSLFNEQQYHDSYLFDIVRRRFDKQGHRVHDIANGAGKRSHHVFINSVLGQCMDHLKGSRKYKGRSHATDLRVSRDEPYWECPPPEHGLEKLRPLT